MRSSTKFDGGIRRPRAERNAPVLRPGNEQLCAHCEPSATASPAATVRLVQPPEIGVVRVADVHAVINDEAGTVVTHLGLVAELDRFSEPTFRYRSRTGLVERDEP